MKNIPALHFRAVQVVKEFQAKEREVLSVIQEVDEQKTYAVMGYSRLFPYLVGGLGLTEAQAYAYSSVSKKSREVPKLKEAVESGLSIYKAQRIVSVLTKENHDEWIQKAQVLTKNELEKQVAEINPTATYRESLRVVAKDRVSLKLEISEKSKEKLKRIQTLLSTSKRKNLTLEETLDEVFEFYLEKKDPIRKLDRHNNLCPGKTIPSQKIEKTPKSFLFLGGEKKKRLLTRRISNFRKLELIQRDQMKCQYKSPDGKICGEERFIQIHHLQPWSQNGGHELENLQTLCEGHHRLKHFKTSNVLS